MAEFKRSSHTLPPDSSPEWKSVASGSDRGKRLDKFWAETLGEQGISRSRVRAWIEAGKALVDGRVQNAPDYRLSGGEALSLAGESVGTSVNPEKGRLAVCYEDEDLLVVDKPAGLTVHPAPGASEGTLVHRLLYHYPHLAELEGLRPGIVHRLDKDTSGLMIVALNEKTRLKLSKQFSARKVGKAYLCLVSGRPERPEGRIDAPIGRHPRLKTRMAAVKNGKPALSQYQVLWSDPDGRFSLLKVRIHTGRTHQIRVHMSFLGHPIIGDRMYGFSPENVWPQREKIAAKLAHRQMLHACDLAFTHPTTGEQMRFVSRPPKDFFAVALGMSRRLQRVVLTGALGSGKSLFLRCLQEHGVPVWSADRAVAELYAPGADGSLLINRRFGDKFMTEDNAVDKKALLAGMLKSDSLRREVEQLIHPLVRHRLARFWEENQTARLAVAEVPLFFEAGWEGKENRADIVVGVFAGRDKRRERLLRRGGPGPGEFEVMESWQWPEEKKIARCDLAVDNTGTPEELKARVKPVLEILAEIRRKKSRALLLRLGGLCYGDDCGNTGGS